MSLEDRQDDDALVENPIDDAIGAQEDLANVLAPELGHLPSSHRGGGGRGRLRAQSLHPPTRRHGVVRCDVLTDLHQILRRVE